MKTLVSTLTALAFAAGIAQAGPYIDKNPIIPDVCDCYPPGLQFGMFTGALFPHNEDDGFGGGVSIGYFFTEQFGVDISYQVTDNEPSEEHLSTVDLVYRLGIDDSNCFSPYVFGGGGVLSDGFNRGLYRAGGGVELRFENLSCLGVFADAAYNWVGSNNDGWSGRVGLRIPW